MLLFPGASHSAYRESLRVLYPGFLVFSMQIHQLRVLPRSRFWLTLQRDLTFWVSNKLMDAAARPAPGTTVDTARFSISLLSGTTPSSPWKSCLLSPSHAIPVTLKEPSVPAFFPRSLYHSLACFPRPLLKLFWHDIEGPFCHHIQEVLSLPHPGPSRACEPSLPSHMSSEQSWLNPPPKSAVPPLQNPDLGCHLSVGRLYSNVSAPQTCCSVNKSCPTLRPHELQHARLPCPSPSPRACSNSCLLSRWCHPIISSSVVPFSSHLHSFPASQSFPVSQLFTSGGQRLGGSASATVLPVNIQGWFPSGPTVYKSTLFLCSVLLISPVFTSASST